MTASFAMTAAARFEAQPQASLQASIAESYRCARELDASVAHFRELLEKVAASSFVAHMCQLKTSVVR